MKRFWISLALLGLLLGSSLFVSRQLEHVHGETATLLRQAAEASPEQMLQTAKLARSRWERHKTWISIAADHGPLDEIDVLFAQLEAAEDTRALRRLCMELAAQLRSLVDSHTLSWENIL